MFVFNLCLCEKSGCFTEFIGLLNHYDYTLQVEIIKCFFIVQKVYPIDNQHIDEGPMLIAWLEVPFHAERGPLIFMK